MAEKLEPRGKTWFSATRRTTALIVVACLAFLAVEAVHVVQQRAFVLDNGKKENANLANSLLQQAELTFRTADALLLATVFRLEHSPFTSDERALVKAMFAQQIQHSPQFLSFAVIDASGEVMASSVETPSGANFADRDYFIHHRADLDAGLYIAPPIRGRANKVWFIPVSRRFNGPDGTFGGVVLAAIKTEYFQELYDRLHIGDNGAILLASLSGKLLVRRPFSDANVGRDMSKSGIFQQLKIAPSGNVEIVSSTDGVRRLNSYTTGTAIPIVVAVAQDTNELLQPWVENTYRRLGEASLLIALFAGLGTVIWRITHRLASEAAKLRESNERLSAATEAAEAANRAKSDFLAMMSHEIRTPMAGMMGMINLLTSTRLNEEQQGLAKVAQESGTNLLTVVNNILDFSKLEAGQLVPEMVAFNMRNTVESVVSLMAAKAGDDLTITSCFADDFPTVLLGDPSRIGQVLLNLVGNAVKFTAKGTIDITVSHRVLAGDDVELQVEIADTGTGIAPEMIGRLFNPFTQADTSISRKYGGSGLGLAICKRLCQTMGGEVFVESQLGQGSKFRFTARCKTATTPVVTAPALAPDRDAPSVEPIAILVAEDNAVLRSLISKLLARRGYEADVVCDGREAVAAVQAKHYDVVLMDMQMPQMDGISAAAAIRALSGSERTVPIIALTANALVGQREICLAAGMNSFLTKPIQPEALYDELARYSPRGSVSQARFMPEQSG
ncbi:response regulator [Bradyrhizobium japonicum]|uniref:hybrid sensor histidine kinase/response regulator n=1 Tax=Bradyrhizobium japonicum TaxID=375 RepID=UPI001BA60C91|nr:hybrid sensor histidine kinase/response regulator [Bradyrhizobium japonicum]MBR0993102.1 response regulator [Bradyrhizobium japonicum]